MKISSMRLGAVATLWPDIKYTGPLFDGAEREAGPVEGDSNSTPQTSQPEYLYAHMIKIELYSDNNWNSCSESFIVGNVYPRAYITESAQGSDAKQGGVTKTLDEFMAANSNLKMLKPDQNTKLNDMADIVVKLMFSREGTSNEYKLHAMIDGPLIKKIMLSSKIYELQDVSVIRPHVEALRLKSFNINFPSENATAAYYALMSRWVLLNTICYCVAKNMQKLVEERLDTLRSNSNPDSIEDDLMIAHKISSDIKQLIKNCKLSSETDESRDGEVTKIRVPKSFSKIGVAEFKPECANIQTNSRKPTHILTLTSEQVLHKESVDNLDTSFETFGNIIIVPIDNEHREICVTSTVTMLANNYISLIRHAYEWAQMRVRSLRN